MIRSHLWIVTLTTKQPLVDILNPAALSLLIDSGRTGYQRQGVCASGPMDSFAYEMANMLLGIPANSSVIEVCGEGFIMQALTPIKVCVTGANGRCNLNGEVIPMWRPFDLDANDVLQIELTGEGYRYYIGFNAQLDSQVAYGSYSTVMRERLGGIHGNGMPLTLGDRLQGTLTKPIENNFTSRQSLMLQQLQKSVYSSKSIRLIPGSQFYQFDRLAWHRLLSSKYRIEQHSNRMGIRLHGPSVSNRTFTMRSEGLTMGSVQVPADGQPIVLMADRQTLGGYPKIANVAMVDLPFLSQRPPGTSIMFAEIDLETSRNEWRLRQYMIKQIRASL